jgi:short-subunit dehydrogenase
MAYSEAISAVIDVVGRAAAPLLTHASGLSTLEWVGLAAATAVAHRVLQALRVAASDCDLTTAAAARALPPRGFEGKKAWIVGASSGIGEALAYELAARGCWLLLSARRVENLRRMIEKCLELGAPGVEVLRLDVLDTEKHKTLAGFVWGKYGRIDFLVNNAGRSQRGLVEATPLEVTADLFKLNVLGVVSVTQACLPHMLAQEGGGTVAITGSVAGKVGSPVSASYSATKWSIAGWSEALRHEVQSRGVRVCLICPGPVKSEIADHSFTDTVGKEQGKADSEDNSKMATDRCALLYAAAMWAGLPEAWIAPQPILAFVYMAQYWRSLYFFVGPRYIGPARVKSFARGQTGYGSVQSLSGIFGAGAKKD